MSYPMHLHGADVLNLDVNGRTYTYTATKPITVKNENEARRLTGAPCYPLTVQAGDYVDLPELDVTTDGKRVRQRRKGFVIAQDYTFADITKVVGFYYIAEGCPDIGMFLPR